MLGRQIVRKLGEDPSQWKTVHALSRSQKEDYPGNVQHNTIDLTADSDGMADILKGVSGEYIFFAAYLQKDSEQENWDVNGQLLYSALALSIDMMYKGQCWRISSQLLRRRVLSRVSNV